MLRAISFVVGFLMAGAVMAADLGKPTVAAVISAPAAVPDMWTAPYIEFGVAGQFAKGNNKSAVVSVGLGYTYHAMGNPWTPGVFARAQASVEGFDDSAVFRFDQPFSAGVTLGYLVSPSTRVYGILGYSKSFDAKFEGPMLGLGVSLPMFGTMRIGGEYTAQFDAFKADSNVANEIRGLVAFQF